MGARSVRIQIHNDDHLLGPRSLTRTRGAVARQLKRFGRMVRSVEITVTSVGRGEGGLDKECRMVVRLLKMDAVVVSVRETSASRAVDRAIGRAERAVDRQIQKRRFLNRDHRGDFSFSGFN